MIKTAEVMAIFAGREIGLQVYANGEADVLVTLKGETEVLEIESFPNRQVATERIREMCGVPKSGSFADLPRR